MQFRHIQVCSRHLVATRGIEDSILTCVVNKNIVPRGIGGGADHIWARGGGSADADEASAYEATNAWKRETGSTDTDEASAYEATNTW